MNMLGNVLMLMVLVPMMMLMSAQMFAGAMEGGIVDKKKVHMWVSSKYMTAMWLGKEYGSLVGIWGGAMMVIWIATYVIPTVIVR